ncbi:MAG: small, acid-soluble spore protein, H family [Clostridiales bacterium]|nr:small, acid-soluble spore protein, H family [Clostridiales bacterium]
MKYERIQEIINSDESIKVYRNGSPVWLEDIQGNNVRIKNLATNIIAAVPFNELYESKIQ